jgi:hypothetical protein
MMRIYSISRNQSLTVMLIERRLFGEGIAPGELPSSTPTRFLLLGGESFGEERENYFVGR